jgi:hypothetical protein
MSGNNGWYLYEYVSGPVLGFFGNLFWLAVTAWFIWLYWRASS